VLHNGTMPDPSKESPGRRISMSGDIEVATYLEIARGEAEAGPTDRPTADEAIVILDLGS